MITKREKSTKKAKKKAEVKTHVLIIKISDKTKRDLEICAAKQSKTVKKFAKEAIEFGIAETKKAITENHTILYTQLSLFDNDKE
jgi:hypothetical protein